MVYVDHQEDAHRASEDQGGKIEGTPLSVAVLLELVFRIASDDRGEPTRQCEHHPTEHAFEVHALEGQSQRVRLSTPRNIDPASRLACRFISATTADAPLALPIVALTGISVA
jgi:hypothetical protein